MTNEDCLETLKYLVCEERDQGRISNMEKVLLMDYLERTKPATAPNYSYCEDCGCRLAYHLGDLENHGIGCSNIPF